MLSDRNSDREAVAAEKDTPGGVEPGAVLAREPASAAGFSWPLRTLEVTSPFGKRSRDFHEGVDLRAPNGTSVFAARAGVVIYAGSRIRGYGNMLVIKHAGGFATVYAHTSKILVRRGQQVHAGQRVAFSGHSGRADGPHLHFEIRKGVVAVNPMNYLRAQRPPQRKVASSR